MTFETLQELRACSPNPYTEEKPKAISLASTKNVRNSNIRKAAEKADEAGNNAYNGALDANEVSMFITYAQQYGCKTSEISAIVDQLDCSNDKSVDAKMQALAIIDKQRSAIKEMKAELDELKARYSKMKPQNTGKILGAIAGGLTAFMLTNKPVSLSKSWKGIFKAGDILTHGAPATIRNVLLVLGGATALGALAGSWLGAKAQEHYGSHDYQVKQHRANEFKTTNIEPLEQKIAEMEANLNQQIENFNNL